MNVAVFDRAIATAERLIDKYGQQVVWNTVVKGASDPATPWKPTQAVDVPHNVVICFLPVDRESRQLFTFLRGTNEVVTGSILGYMKGNLDFIPHLQDTITRDGLTLKIKTLDLLSPNGQKVLYILELEQ